MTNSIVDITSQRLKKIKLFIEHMDRHPIHMESVLQLEREAIYKPLSPDLKSVVLQTMSNNLLHKYNESYFIDLKDNLSNYMNISGFEAENFFISSNIYNFYEYLTELFLQKDQKIMLFTADDYDFAQEAKYINSGRIVIERLNSPCNNLSEMIGELVKDDYKIIIYCAQSLDPENVTTFVDLLPENVVLVLRTSDPLAFNYIKHGNKTILVLREFPATMTIVEPAIAFAVSRKEIINMLNDLQVPNRLDTISLFISKYFTSLENPVDHAIKTSLRSTEGYKDILSSLIRENIETIKPKEEYYNAYNVAKRLHIPINEVIDFSNGEHFLGLSEDLKESLIKFADSQERHNYYSQRTLLRNMIAHNVSMLSKKIHYNNVLLGAGVTGLLESITRAFLNDGEGYKKLYKDKALILDFSPDNYTRVIEKRDAYVEKVSLNPGLIVDLDDIIAKIKQLKPKMVIIDNPRILVGTYIDKNQMQVLFESIPENTVIVIDESYNEYAKYENIDYVSAVEFIDQYSNLVVLRSFSFTNALAGMRLGYAVAQESIINCIDSVRQPFDVSPFAIHLGIELLQGTDVFEKVTVKYVKEQKDAIYQFLNQMGLFYITSSTNSILFSTPIDARDLQERLLPYKILIKPLSNNFARFSINEQKHNVYFIKSLKMALGSHLHN